MTTHLSTRLVWHDRAWDGHVCDHPSKNAYCIVQEHIREARDDAKEDKAAGVALAELKTWQAWDRKRQWYEDNRYLDRVITSEDGANGSIDAAEIERIARKKILMEG